jgi:predicted MFS family arabinose efflux permease
MNAAGGPVPTRTIIFLAAAAFASAASLRAADPILPDIALSFATTPGDAAKIVTFFGAAYALAQFAYGFVGDCYGKLRTIFVTTLLSALSTLLCALAPSLDMLTLARIAVGLTAAAIIPLAFAWIGDVVPYEQRQSVLARFLSGQISGMVLGQAFGGIIAEHFGWRFVFVAIAVFFLAGGAALGIELRRRGPEPAGVDTAAGPPLARLRSLLVRPWVAIMLVAVFLEGLMFFGAFTFVGSYLWAKFGLGLDIVGLIVAGFGIGGLLYSATAKQLLARLGERGLASWGGILCAIALLAVPTAPTPLLVVPATILAGFSYYMLHNTMQTNATQMAPDARGLAVAAFASSLFLGQAAGVAIAAPVFDYTGGVPIFLGAAVSIAALGIVFRLCLRLRP